jgi:DNA-binding transcriptional regulator YiaG
MTAAELKARREKLFPMQKHAAQAFGVSKSSISLWENGKARIPNYVGIILDFLERNPEAVRAIVNKSETVMGREE